MKLLLKTNVEIEAIEVMTVATDTKANINN